MYSILYFLIYVFLTIFKYVVGLSLILTMIMKLIHVFTKKMCNSSNRLDGKVVLVTGGNAGIGLETARELARRGASVVIASRDERRSAASAADIAATTGSQRVHHRPLDLASFASVRRFAADFARDFPRLDILVNNAGCAGLNHKLTEDGINVAMQINYFGPFLLTNLLLDSLLASEDPRVVIVSSLLHRFADLKMDDLTEHKKVHYMRSYANSKLCQVLWAKALAREYSGRLSAYSLHPGAVATNIFQRLGPTWEKIVTGYIRNILKSPVEGCQTTVHLCVSDEVCSGGYYSECAPGWVSRASKDQQLVEQVYHKSLLITNS